MRYFFLITIFVLASSIFTTPSVDALTVSPVRLEVSGEPGTVVVGQLDLYNEENEEKTFYSSFENFEARGESSAPYFTGGGQGLASWFETEPSIVLKPSERKTIPFSITIPKEAEPGGHFAAIFWGTAPPKPEAGGELAVGGKVGILVLLSVAGEIKESGGLIELSLKDKQKIAVSLPIVFNYRFSNDGNEKAKPSGELKIKNIFGLTKVVLDANRRDGYVLPKSVRKFEIIWETKKQDKFAAPLAPKEEEIGFFKTAAIQRRQFVFGLYKAELNLTYGQEQKSAQSSFRFLVIPWQLLSIIVVILVILGVLGIIGVRKYNAWIISKVTRYPR